MATNSLSREPPPSTHGGRRAAPRTPVPRSTAPLPSRRSECVCGARGGGALREHPAMAVLRAVRGHRC